MATIKSFTDLQQSKKLAEILPIESADMVIWGKDLDAIAATDAQKFMKGLKDRKMNYIPCWSLTALLSVIRETIGYILYGINNVYMSCNLGDKPYKLETEVYDNEVDACYEMILKLHELKML